MSNNTKNQHKENDISFNDIVKFVIKFWKKLVFSSLLGILGALVFISVVPNQYEAIAQIQMMQIRVVNNAERYTYLNTNVEDSALLMARMRLPSSYTKEEIEVCGFQNSKLTPDVLTNKINLSQVKGVASTVELRIRANTRDQALKCAEVIYENIRRTQKEIVKPYLRGINSILNDYQDQLKDIQIKMAKLNKEEQILSSSNMINYENIRYLKQESGILNTLIKSNEKQTAKLIAPIYSQENPISPKPKIALVLGLIAGFLAGLLYILIKTITFNYLQYPLK